MSDRLDGPGATGRKGISCLAAFGLLFFSASACLSPYRNSCPPASAEDRLLCQNPFAQGQGDEYGAASRYVRRIEELLKNSQSVLENSDYFEFQNSLHTLKQSVANELSRGADGSAIAQPLQSLELQINGRLQDILQQRENKRGQLETSLLRIEVQLLRRRPDLIAEDYKSFSARLDNLKAKAQQSGSLPDESRDRLVREAQELEMELTIAPHRGGLVFHEDETKTKSVEGQAKSAKDPADPTEKESSNAPVEMNVTRLPRRPPLAIPKLIEQIENMLIEFHEKHQIGSFDMDSFTSRLLAQKRNLHVMLSKTGRLSLRQESVLREDLEQLQSDLLDQVAGKN